MDLMAATLTNPIAKPAKASDASQAMSDVRKSSSNSKEKNSFQSKLTEKQSWDSGRGSSSKLNPNPKRNELPSRSGRDQASSRLAHDEANPNVRKTREPATKNSKAEAVDSLTRRAALQSFMKKMKQDLNVNPGQIVSALMALTPDQLQLPPQMNVNQIVGQLELDPVATEKAKVFFDQMLAESSANSMADYLKGSKRQLSLEVMSQAESRQANLENSLQQMNSQFFTAPKNEASQGSTQSTDEKLAGLLAAMGVSGAAAMGAVQQAGGQASQSAAGGNAAVNPFLSNQMMANQQAAGDMAQSAEAGEASGFASQSFEGSSVVEASQANTEFLKSMKSMEAGKTTAGAGLAAYGMSA
ncbi:MAG: hypothetical protein AAF202_08980, partial [Pseudomonadota bacterium]